MLGATVWAATCPKGLEAAAHEYLMAQQQIQYATRDATTENPVGVEPASLFDLEIHACHSAPGQHYRIYRSPVCQEPADDGAVEVRFPFELKYRAAETMEKLFAAPWKEGTEGIWQVRFERRPEGWVVVKEKEVLDLGGKKAGHGAGTP